MSFFTRIISSARIILLPIVYDTDALQRFHFDSDVLQRFHFDTKRYYHILFKGRFVDRRCCTKTSLCSQERTIKIVGIL